MDKILKNKILIYYLLLVAFCIFVFSISYSKFGFFFIDTSREAYIPMIMNKGSVLYKDIFNIFTPLSYQINAVLFLIFGENLRTLYFAGFFNSLVFLSGIFSISVLLLKKYPFFSFIFSLFITVSCVFAVSQGNYIFPYAYSAVYSLSAIVWSLFFLLYHIKTEKNIFLILSFFLFGICLSIKYDFIFFLIILLYFLIKKKQALTIIYCTIAFISVPLFSFSILHFQGVNFDNLINAYSYVNKLLKSPASVECYKFMGIIPTKDIFKTLVFNFLTTIGVISCIFGIIYKLYKKGKSIYIYFFSAGLIFVFAKIFFESNAFYFSWIGIFLIILFILFCIHKKTKKITDKLFFVLFLSTILISIKSITSLNFNNYGTFYFPLIALCVISSIFYYAIKTLKDKKAFYESFYAVFIILTFCYFISNYERRNYTFTYEIKTEKGRIYVNENTAESIKSTLKYINENSTTKDKILVLPEGAMLNFLTSRKSDNKYFYLIPSNIEVFGEKEIVRDLEENLPDYIILQPMSYTNFGKTYFCESFGLEICALLPKYYDMPKIYGNDFWLAVYKKKNPK